MVTAAIWILVVHGKLTIADDDDSATSAAVAVETVK